MSAKDVVSRDTLRRRLDLPAAELAGEIVRTHAENNPDMKISYGFCLNSDALDPWESSLELLEIGEGIINDPDPDFHPTEFRPEASQAWPRIKIILANPREFATPPGREFAAEVAAKLRAGSARVVFASPDPATGAMIEPLLRACQPAC